MKNVYVERFQKKLGCGAMVTRFRETVFDEDDSVEDSLKKKVSGTYFKDSLWDEEN
ncbi:MAG: hypothetical protein ACLFN8_05495 [Candidatus Woesearchaeota archaeon]